MKKQLDFTDEDFLDNFVAYQQSLTKSARHSQFVVANRLYVQNFYEVNENFREIATEKLSSGVEMIDLTNQVKAAKIINDFAAQKTHYKTGDICKPEFLNGYPRVVLMNTIYVNVNFEKVI